MPGLSRCEDGGLPRGCPIEPFKNALNAEAVDLITTFVGGAWDRRAFTRAAVTGLEALELKDRVNHIADALRIHLPTDWPTVVRQIAAHLPEEPTGTGELVSRMALWPVLSLVERHGLEHPDASLELLGRLTPFWSAEFAVRPYFAADPARMQMWLERWSTDTNVHRRRLASEGSRPRLPWGIRLTCRIDAPLDVLPVLLRLRDDPSEYVRRSVANHLNDIAKDHPDVVLAIARDWISADKQRTKLVRHALRTQIKAGDPAVYTLLGLLPFAGDCTVHTTPTTLTVGEALTVTVTLTSAQAQRVRLDLGLHFRRANATLSTKVFHWTERSLKAGQTLTLTKRYPVKRVTTRRLYPGEQAIDVRLNGVAWAPHPFTLTGVEG